MGEKETAYASSGGLGFIGLLTIVFITLKLCGVITWSWWWVLSPLLIVWGIFFAVILFLLAMAALTKIIE